MYWPGSLALNQSTMPVLQPPLHLSSLIELMSWWCYPVEAFSVSLALCVGKSPHKGQWRGTLMFSLIYAWINGWVNNQETPVVWDAIAFIMMSSYCCWFFCIVCIKSTGAANNKYFIKHGDIPQRFSKWQVLVKPVIKISLKWYFHFSEGHHIFLLGLRAWIFFKVLHSNSKN